MATLSSKINPDTGFFATAAQGTLADTSLQPSDLGVTVQEHSITLDNTTASFTVADETKLDGIEAGATADQTASEILTAIKTVDGAGSGLDADLLDGLSSASFLRSDANTATTGYLQAEGFVNSGTGSLSIFNPQGASYATGTATVTGAIKITLPQSWTSTMMRMTIRIYEYATNEGFEVVCGGYNYTGATWANNPFAYIIGSPNVNRNFNIRFGHDGTYCCIYIGEANSTWSYPQVAVTHFVAGYSNYTAEQWNDGWAVGFTTTIGTITATISNAELGRFIDGGTIWHSGNDGAASGLDADLLDGNHASAFSLTSHNHTLDGLSNTTITSNTAGEILKWNGTAWVNNTLAEAGIQPAGSYLTGNQTITLSGDLTGSGTTSINAQIAANVVGAAELNVTGNGTTAQYLRSDGDGSFTWATPTDTNTTYTAGNGITLTGTAFSVAAGGGLTQDAGGLSHADTSTQASVNNSGLTYIQGITLDGYGHVTAIGSATVDTTPTTAQVASATAGIEAGAVGSYAWAAPRGVSYTFGSTMAGSSLRPGGFTHDAYSDARAATSTFGSAALTGTWRAMGATLVAASSTRYSTAVWLRIA